MKRQFILFASFFLLTVVSFQVTLYFMSLGERPQRKTIIAAPKITKSVPKLAKKIDAAPRPIKKELTGSELARQAEELWNDQTADPDKTKAVAMFRKAYAKGATSAAGYRLGLAYYYGYGVEKNIETAEKYFSIPALAGYNWALYYRGLIIADEKHPQRSVNRARILLQRAQNMGVLAAKAALERLPAPGQVPNQG